MIETGRLCIKTAGRDAGKHALVIDIIDANYVLIDGQVRRRKCNMAHLEPLDKVVKINKKASHEDVKKALKEIGIDMVDTKLKEKKERPRKQRGAKKKEILEEKAKEKKKAVKKEKASKEKSKAEEKEKEQAL